MTREEKQKAIDALKMSAPIMAVTQEEFKDYIQTLNKVMDWLEQEPTRMVDKSNFSQEQYKTDLQCAYDCGKSILDKIRAEIKQYQSDYDVHGTEYDRTAWKAFNRCLQSIDKYKAESEE